MTVFAQIRHLIDECLAVGAVHNVGTIIYADPPEGETSTVIDPWSTDTSRTEAGTRRSYRYWHVRRKAISFSWSKWSAPLGRLSR